MDGDETVVDVAKKETTRQTVILVFSLAGTVAMVWIMRAASNPDLVRTLKMGVALRVKRVARQQELWWRDLGDRAGSMYNRERW